MKRWEKRGKEQIQERCIERKEQDGKNEKTWVEQKGEGSRMGRGRRRQGVSRKKGSEQGGTGEMRKKGGAGWEGRKVVWGKGEG